MTAIVTEPLQTEAGQAEQAMDEPRTLKQIIAEVQATGEPLLVTMEGKPQFVAMSVEAYQALQDRIEHWENVASLYKADAEGDYSRDKPAREFFEEFRQKHGIPR